MILRIFHFSGSALILLLFGGDVVLSQDSPYNAQVLRAVTAMPNGGTYARYRKDLPSGERFNDLYQTIEDLGRALDVGVGGRLSVKPAKAKKFSFCSSATYLVFSKVVEELQKEGVIPKNKQLSRELSDVGDKMDVIQGKMDGIGIFGHWNADGPGTGVLFQRLGLGSNFSSYEKAQPGDFLKIFWNDKIGKGERGHSVVYMGSSEDGKSIKVWSSQTKNEDASTGYGTMWVEKTKIKRALFSRLEHPANLAKWLQFSVDQKKSHYLIRIRKTGSSGTEMKAATGSVD